MLENILNAANKYADGLKNVMDRRTQWLASHKTVHDHLLEIAKYLNEKALYNPGFYVDTNHAFNEEINGTCAAMPSLTFRSGAMPLNIVFKNAGGDKREYVEEGFHITFTPTIIGQIVVLLAPHYSSLSTEKPGYLDLAVIENPAALTAEVIQQIIGRGIEIAFYSSFTGMVEQQQKLNSEDQKKFEHTPIGFKRYESSEKVK